MTVSKLKRKEIKDINKRFALLCKYYRSKNSLSTQELGERFGCSKSMVEAYESIADSRGLAAPYDALKRIATGFDMSVSSLIKFLEGTENEEGDSDELAPELARMVKNLTSKTWGNFLFLLGQDKEKIEEIIEVACELSRKNLGFTRSVGLLTQLPEDLAQKTFELMDLIKSKI